MHFPSVNDPYANAVAVPCPQSVAKDYFNTNVNLFMAGETAYPYPDRQGFATTTSPPSPEPPGSAVSLTRDMVSLMQTMPVNAAAMGKMSASATMIFQYGAMSAVPQPYAPAPWALGTAYNVLDRVMYTDASGNVSYYVCIQAVLSSQSIQVSNTSYWLPAVVDVAGSPVSTVPVLLDGWGNPIIFVPSGILGVPLNTANLNAQGKVIPGSGAMESGTGGSAMPIQAKSPDGRPFWASAGPDGDFSLGDDNMYSFEK
jgi:hypothetical protein